MTDLITAREIREATHYAGDMAASRLHDLIEERFRELEAAGDTQADVARRLGLAPQQVQRWIAEPTNMTIRSAGRLLAALDAHLIFQLDRYEEILAGNSAPPKPIETGSPDLERPQVRGPKVMKFDIQVA